MRTHRITMQAFLVLLSCQFFQPIPVTSQDAGSNRIVTLGSPESNADGKAAIEKLMNALGGAGSVNAVRTLCQNITVIQKGQEKKLEQCIAYPDKQTNVMRQPNGERVRFVVTPTLGFSAVGTRVHDLDAAQRASADVALKHNILNVLQHLNDPRYTFIATGKKKVGTVDAVVVDVNVDGTKTRWWIAPDGTLLQKEAYEGGHSFLIKFSAWKTFGGLRYPTRSELFDAAGLRLTEALVSMEVNSAINPKLFEKPIK